MKQFRPEDLRRRLRGHDYAFYMGFERSEFEPHGALASCASGVIVAAVQCEIVGMSAEARCLLMKAREWLQAAIAKGEHPRHYSPGGTESLRYADLALANWLLDGKHDAESLALGVDCEEAYLASLSSGRSPELSLALPLYVDAARYGQALDQLAATPSLKPPARLRQIRSEAFMCYVLCRHKLGQQFSQDEVKTALGGFLNANVEAWLVDGISDRVARWMKIAYWNEAQQRSPQQALLMVYEHLRQARASIANQSPRLST